jgi:hypothetical protein
MTKGTLVNTTLQWSCFTGIDDMIGYFYREGSHSLFVVSITVTILGKTSIKII